jgi:exosortase
MNLETSRPKPELSAAGVSQGAPASTERFIPSWRRFKWLTIFSVVLALVFVKPLLALLAYAPHDDLFSHILLIPFISAYLIWIKRKEFVPESEPNRRLALLPFLIGAAVLIGYQVARGRGWMSKDTDYLAVMTFAFLCFLFVGAFVFVEAKYLKSITFPLAFLLFCVPFPQIVRDGIEAFFQHGSADVAYWMLTLSGMPVLRDGTYFKMPAFALSAAAFTRASCC